MKHLVEYKIFESKFLEFKEMIDTLKDMCQEFEDNGCSCRVEPSNDIRIKVISLQGKGDVFQDINMPFYIEIDIDRRIISPDENKVGLLPEWFVDNCERISDYMETKGYTTLPSIKRPSEWENLETVGELSDVLGIFWKVNLEFVKNRSIQEGYHDRVMTIKYGDEVLDECDEVIQNIKDMLLELEDIGLESYVIYSPMTCAGREQSPKIVVDINADERLFASKIQDVHNVTDAIKSYVKSLGFVIGEGTWTTDGYVTRQILIQK